MVASPSSSQKARTRPHTRDRPSASSPTTVYSNDSTALASTSSSLPLGSEEAAHAAATTLFEALRVSTQARSEAASLEAECEARIAQMFRQSEQMMLKRQQAKALLLATLKPHARLTNALVTLEAAAKASHRAQLEASSSVRTLPGMLVATFAAELGALERVHHLTGEELRAQLTAAQWERAQERVRADKMHAALLSLVATLRVDG